MKKWFSSLMLLSSCTLSVSLSAQPEFTEQQLEQIASLRTASLDSTLSYRILESLTTEVGPRLPGSPNDKLAVEWAKKNLNALGFDKVWLEPMTFPHWRRLSEAGRITSPNQQPLHLTALGGSVSTPDEGLNAEIVLFETLDELIAAPEGSLNGKIAFINYRMNRHIDGNGYGPAVKARSSGAVEAAKKGAIGYMMRSVATGDHRFAHTGGSHYQEGVKKIPAVAIANPDADQIARLVAYGKTVRVDIALKTENLGEGQGYNLIGQINGSESPEQYVLIGGHLDSWDLGTGALDDGAGVAISMAAAKLVADQGRPKRSIRVVLFAAEELGLWGGKAYFKAHEKELDRIVAAAESDFGADRIHSFESHVDAASLPLVREMAAQLAPLNIEYIGKNAAHGGPDLIPFKNTVSAPVFSLYQDGSDYFDYHHTADDTFDKVELAKLQQNTAAYAVFAYMAANAKTRIQAKPTQAK